MDPRRDTEPDPVRRSALHIASLISLFGGMYLVTIGVYAAFDAADRFWLVALIPGLPSFIWGLRTQIRLVRQERDSERQSTMGPARQRTVRPHSHRSPAGDAVEGPAPQGELPEWFEPEQRTELGLRDKAGEAMFDIITSLPDGRFQTVRGVRHSRWAAVALGVAQVVLILVLHFGLRQPWGEALKWGVCWVIVGVWALFVVYLAVLALTLPEADMESDAFLIALLRRMGIRSVLGLRVVAFFLLFALIFTFVAFWSSP